MNTQNTGTTSDARTRLSPNIILWASAFVIAAMILIQAGRSGEARADLVSSVGGVTALTVAGAASEDFLMVIDGRSEELFVYRVENQNNLELYRRYSLPRMFTDARGRGAGGGRR